MHIISKLLPLIIRRNMVLMKLMYRLAHSCHSGQDDSQNVSRVRQRSNAFVRLLRLRFHRPSGTEEAFLIKGRLVGKIYLHF